MLSFARLTSLRLRRELHDHIVPHRMGHRDREVDHALLFVAEGRGPGGGGVKGEVGFLKDTGIVVQIHLPQLFFSHIAVRPIQLDVVAEDVAGHGQGIGKVAKAHILDRGQIHRVCIEEAHRVGRVFIFRTAGVDRGDPLPVQGGDLTVDLDGAVPGIHIPGF